MEKKLTKKLQKEREEALKDWYYPEGVTYVVTASGTLAPAPKTIEEAIEFRERDMFVEGANDD